jgi:hypothetical protein
MPAPKSIFTLLKVTSALAISTLLLLQAAHTSEGSALAQTNIDETSPTEALSPSGNFGTDPIVNVSSSFQPPNNPRSQSRSRTTTGTYFQPPRNPRSRGSRTTTGTRQGSCLSDTETAFTIFGPDATIGQTVSTHPEFVWHLPASETAFPVIFRLLAPNEAGIPTPIHTEILTYSAGFMKYQLPPTLPAVSAGIEYRWQVVVECNPNYPSRSLVQELSFEVVPAPAGLSQALSTAATETDKAAAYGQAGLWYDAIAPVSQATTAAAQEARTALLQDLAELESANEELSQDILSIAETTAQ